MLGARLHVFVNADYGSDFPDTLLQHFEATVSFQAAGSGGWAFNRTVNGSAAKPSYERVGLLVQEVSERARRVFARATRGAARLVEHRHECGQRLGVEDGAARLL